MKKISIKTILLITYEIIRLFFILKASPVQDIPFQSLSWYASISFLSFPLIFIILYSYNRDKYDELKSFISLSKLLSVVGFTSYFCATLKESLMQIRFSQFNSIITLFFMMFFLLIDVIIGLIFIKKQK